MSKQFWGILIAIVLVFFGVIVLSNKEESKTPAAKGTPTNHVQGTSAKGVKLVEYGDYQCPGCGGFYQAFKDVAEKYKDTVQVQFRNLPLPSLHPNAFAAARAAEAAGLQNKFWEMHDRLYQENVTYYNAQQQGKTISTWISASDPLPFFKAYAKELGLNEAQFATDFASTKVNDLVNADITAFKQTKDDMATPTFYLNGKKLENTEIADSAGQPSVEAFSKAIDAALKAK
ncbi:thioredoxin domain-containing protein [soil metagenome]